ncbi:MAG: hypothetical protein LAT83_23655 [Kiritimatiellae bacterium]|nr:hypothetical protein [Kiritimatiellia bacterium]
MLPASKFISLLALSFATLLPAAEVTRQIPNTLRHSWPWDLTHFDLDPEDADNLTVAEASGHSRPLQIERINRDGQDIARTWFVATIDEDEEYQDANGRTLTGTLNPVPVILRDGPIEPGITRRETDQFHLIDNGVYEFRLRKSQSFSEPRPLSQVPHWFAGARLKGHDAWDGRAWFEGDALVERVEVQVIQEGPVFIDMHVRYHFSADEDGLTEALPLDLGKQTHTWEANHPPREEVPKRSHAYELKLRFVMGDTWVEANERFHLPDGIDAGDHDFHHYWIAWGNPQDTPDIDGFSPDDHMPVDTVTWVRWFLYDRFGGNTSQHWVPAEPRPDQQGRPFARLQPRWTQSGGGAQDFVLTSGGESHDGNLDNPAVGIVAAFASKWVNPYPAIIEAYAEDGNRGRARFPLRDGGNTGLHYGQRAYGLNIGPRDAFRHLNSLVRRHTDWTLVAKTNKYILDWERDPDLAGPNAYITRERLEELRQAYHSGEGETARILAAELEERETLLARREELQPQVRELNQRRNDEDLPEAEREEADAAHTALREELRDIERTLNGTDMEILRMITSDYSKNINPQDAGLWMGRRYQDDFLNPTSSPTRNVKNFAVADLFADGRPVGGPQHAALGYISTDLDAWPGWHQGWSPGNPNFHTDKYMGAIYIASAMRDHPHADEWLAFGYDNFMDDVDRVLYAPDGVGYECPGYAGYALNLQLGLAQIFVNTGFGNPVAENPLFQGTGVWHRKLITPHNHRIDARHAAPFGDTHRWTSGFNHGFGKLASFYSEADPQFASEMQGAWQLLLDNGHQIQNPLRTRLIDSDPGIPPMDSMDMDWSSETFYGFGVLMRNNFGSPRESFLGVKAGHARGHYHNDELAYHFYSGGEPISLAYHTGYAPRADHAALQNSMTFGHEGPVRHNQRGEDVHGMEQIHGAARAGAFAPSEIAALFVAERPSSRIVLSPLDPNDHEFGRRYDGRQTGTPVIHRRFITLVKQDLDSPLSDYIVVLDETQSDEPQTVNIHLLSRDLTVDGNHIHATGQHGKDMTLFVAHATDLDIDIRHWSYSAGNLKSPGEDYTIRPDETLDQWTRRIEALKQAHGVDTLPLPGWEARRREGRGGGEEFQAWQNQIRETDGKALIPPRGWNETWLYGEYQQWVRLNTAPGTPVLWVLYPHQADGPQPAFETLADGQGVRVTLGDHTDEIHLATHPGEGIPGQALIRRNGEETLLLQADALPPLGQIEDKPLPK